MSAITMGTSVARAKQRFPYTPAQHIRGTGDFALVFKCRTPWRVNLYATAAERDAAWEHYQFSSCGATRCDHNHPKVNL
jgi:hypothetical protein